MVTGSVGRSRRHKEKVEERLEDSLCGRCGERLHEVDKKMCKECKNYINNQNLKSRTKRGKPFHYNKNINYR